MVVLKPPVYSSMEEWKGCWCLRLCYGKEQPESCSLFSYSPKHFKEFSVGSSDYFPSGRTMTHGACSLGGKDAEVLCSCSAPFSVCLPSCLLILNEHCTSSVILNLKPFFPVLGKSTSCCSGIILPSST